MALMVGAVVRGGGKVRIHDAAEQHRELCRQHLRLVVSAGYNPMKFFDNDYKKYFYLAELYSLIDLSSVRLRHIHFLISVWRGCGWMHRCYRGKATKAVTGEEQEPRGIAGCWSR